MKALVYELTLIEPLLVTEVGKGDPNSAASLSYLPGSAIRGALINRRAKGKEVDALESPFYQLFFDQQVKFLNVYPVGSGRERLLPTPLAWRIEKNSLGGDQALIHNFAIQEVKAEPGEQWKDFASRHPFCQVYPNPEQPDLPAVETLPGETEIHIHIARASRQKVVADDLSAIFRYRSLPAGMVMQGAILCQDAGLKAELDELLSLNAYLEIGKSQRAGYGLVQLTACDWQDDWQEFQPVGPAGDKLVVTLLSDMLVRDPHTGEYTNDLGTVLNSRPRCVYARSRIVGSFNRRWNLPLPQALAIQAGSVFVFPADSALERTLRTWVDQGYGERRQEGFGRIAVNWCNTLSLQTDIAPGKPLPPPVKLSGDSTAQAQKMVDRMLRAEIETQLTRQINLLVINPKPSNALLSRLRLLVRQAMQARDTAKLHTDITDKKLRKPARDQLQGAKVSEGGQADGQPLDEWIASYAAEPGKIWRILQPAAYALGGVSADRDKLAVEYTLRLIDGTLYKASKEQGGQ